ncbi:MAG: diguanylate cyclase [Microthrixaceae bacterium]
MGLRRLTGILLGCVGLALGIAGLVADLPVLGLAGGVAAVLAGLVAFGAAATLGDAELRATTAETETATLRRELATATQNLNEERTQHDATRQSLADYMADQPAAGSFDRKLSDTEAPLGQRSTTPSPTDTRLLADPETNLFSEAYFRVALDARIASARRHLRPVAVALVEVVEGSGAPGSPEADATKVTGSIRQTLRDADTACRMADGCFALILEDTPENGAVWTVERIRRNLTSRFGQHTMWAGVACYPAHAFSTDELLDQASLALESAREWKQDRIEVATAE